MPIQKAGSLFGAYAPGIISPRPAVFRILAAWRRGRGAFLCAAAAGCGLHNCAPSPKAGRGFWSVVAPTEAQIRGQRFSSKPVSPLKSVIRKSRPILAKLLCRAGGISPRGVHNPTSMKCGLPAVRGALTKSPVDKAHVCHIVLALVAALAAGTGCHAVNCHGKPITAFIVSANGPGPRKQPRGAGNYRHGRSGRKGKDF